MTLILLILILLLNAFLVVLAGYLLRRGLLSIKVPFVMARITEMASVAFMICASALIHGKYVGTWVESVALAIINSQ